MGFTVRSPGSWLGGSWVSALLIGFCCLHLHRDLTVLSVWLCFCLMQDPISSNLSAHKLPFWPRAHPLLRGGFCVLLCFLGVFWVCFVGFLCCLFRSFLHPHWTCWTAYWSTLSFESPMREHTVLFTIRSLAQTLCYDLARAEKAKDGKKSPEFSIIRLKNSSINLKPDESLFTLGKSFDFMTPATCALSGSISPESQLKSGFACAGLLCITLRPLQQSCATAHYS